MGTKEEESCKSCNVDDCSAKNQLRDEKDKEYMDRMRLMQRLCRIDHKILVLSGKGGVGKSTVAVNIAVSLAKAGKRTGLLDIDIHGPSIPKLLHLEGTEVEYSGEGLHPVLFEGNLKVMSIGLLLQNTDDAVIWRGPMKHGAIKQFLKDVTWGELDYLVVDSPPGTGDEPLSIAQLVPEADGAVIVTTPQEVALVDVRKCIMFCRKLRIPVLGVVENMSGFVCPHCGGTADIFSKGGGESMAKDMGVTFLGRIPIDPQIVTGGDTGQPLVSEAGESETARAFQNVVEKLMQRTKARKPVEQ
jgi:Mrp family chromosome partitioning ATPase